MMSACYLLRCAASLPLPVRKQIVKVFKCFWKLILYLNKQNVVFVSECSFHLSCQLVLFKKKKKNTPVVIGKWVWPLTTNCLLPVTHIVAMGLRSVHQNILLLWICLLSWVQVFAPAAHLVLAPQVISVFLSLLHLLPVNRWAETGEITWPTVEHWYQYYHRNHRLVTIETRCGVPAPPSRLLSWRSVSERGAYSWPQSPAQTPVIPTISQSDHWVSFTKCYVEIS